MTKKVISTYAEEILRRIVNSRETAVDDHMRLRVSGKLAPESVTRQLVRAGFLRIADGRARVSEAGRSYLRRRAHASLSQGPDSKGDGELVSSFRAQHMALSRRRTHPRGKTGPLVNLAESPLKRLSALKDRRGRAWFSPRLIAAGERLRTDFELAGLRARMTIRYEPIAPDPSGRRWHELTPSERMLDARQRFHEALAAVGPGLRDVLIAVCCHLEGLERVEQRLDWPQRAGKLVLRIALERLADHYDGRRTSPQSNSGVNASHRNIRGA